MTRTRRSSKKRAVGRSKSVKKTRKRNPVSVIYVKKVMTDKAIAAKEGEYFPESHYKTIVNEDTDAYRVDEKGNNHLLLRFRKNVLPLDLCSKGIKNLKKAAMKKHDNRGAAGGIIDLKKMPKYANDPKLFVKKNKFRIVSYISKDKGTLVNSSLGNNTTSNIIGYFDKPDRNIKINPPQCRKTAFTAQEVEKWKNSVPLIRAIDAQFKFLIPDKYATQYKRAHKTPFVIKGTAFSTVTINYNWRTALHKDAGDLKDGFGNLVVLEEGKYEGGYTGYPQYSVCVDVRQGDFLGMDVHEWHCNTKIKPITKDYTRLSLVAYLREKMIRCKNDKLLD